MSEEKTVTEREARERERAAFEDGAQWQFRRRGGWASVVDGAHDEANRRYPITKKVPRVVRLPGGLITAQVDEEGKVRFGTDGSTRTNIDYLCSADMPIIAALLDNPFEEVPE